jgi:SAM-dependent methyltransferase
MVPRADWEVNAAEWARRAGSRLDLSREHILFPAIGKLLANLTACEVLDAGCGSGDLGVHIWQTYGHRVVGVDFSFAMCAEARRRAHGSASVVCGDITLLPLRNESFDAVIANMALSSLADLEGCCSEFARVLRPSGILIFTVLHPARVIPVDVAQASKAGFGNAAASVERIENYLEERRLRAALRLGGEGWLPRTVWYYHRTLSSYMAALRNNGLVTINLLEPLPEREVLQSYPKMSKFWKLAPFLIWVARK